MHQYPQLIHIGLKELIDVAGGNPWHISETLQAGDPGTIADLGRTFVEAGACTAQTYQEFEHALIRFRQSWNRDYHHHPIDNSAEIYTATQQLTVQREQLPEIGTVLTTIAADLAQTQQLCTSVIANLNTQLTYIDALIGQALAGNNNTTELEDSAINVTTSTLTHIERLRDDYAARLEKNSITLRSEYSYDPTRIEGVDGDDELGPEQHSRQATEYYRTTQRARDEEIVHNNTQSTPEKADAAARLRDFAIATHPATTAEMQYLAGQRLDDFRMAHFIGPLPIDPVQGSDARNRAQSRLAFQHQLERGAYGITPMTPDHATAFLNRGEQFWRIAAAKHAVTEATQHRLSPEGATALMQNLATYGDLAIIGTEHYTKTLPSGQHALPHILSPAEAKMVARLAGRISRISDIAELTVAVNDWLSGGSNEQFGSTAGEVVGGAAGALAVAVPAATLAGPLAVTALAIGAAVACGYAGKHVGTYIGRSFDS